MFRIIWNHSNITFLDVASKTHPLSDEISPFANTHKSLLLKEYFRSRPEVLLSSFMKCRATSIPFWRTSSSLSHSEVQSALPTNLGRPLMVLDCNTSDQGLTHHFDVWKAGSSSPYLISESILWGNRNARFISREVRDRNQTVRIVGQGLWLDKSYLCEGSTAKIIPAEGWLFSSSRLRMSRCLKNETMNEG